jgi:uncharacterized membrane protein YuzA (DUF378 family)
MYCNANGCKGHKCTSAKIGKLLVVIGGINWGLVGLGMLLGNVGGWNVVHMIFGSMPTLEAIVYVLVGIAAIMKIFGCKCKKCMGGTCAVDGGKMDGGTQGKM